MDLFIYLFILAGVSTLLMAAGGTLLVGSISVNVYVKLLQTFVSRRRCNEAENVVRRDEKLTVELQDTEKVKVV